MSIVKKMSLADCLAHADETKELVLKKDALTELPDLLSGHFALNSVCLIADENTYKAAGKRVEGIIRDAGIHVAGVHVFPGEPRLHAEYDHVLFLKKWIESLPGCPALVPVVIGAGTLNDLVKRTSLELDITYLCVPTAASVDGFTPNGAALLKDGLKQTLMCPAPRVLAADTEIIARAPAYLSSSGFGDLASKITAGTDWIVADKAGRLGAPEAHAIESTAWAMVQDGLRDALDQSVNAAAGDSDAVKTLFESLAITGFAMQYMKNSRPVSGAEHMWSHIWEMEDLCYSGVPVTHGHKVSIGTLAATAFTEIFFADPKGPPARAKTYQRPGREERKAAVSAAFKNSPAHDLVVKVSLEKMMERETVDAINEAFRDSWTDIRDRVLERLLPYGELTRLFSRAGCPVRGEDIGLGRADVIATSRRAQMMRNRYTLIDLAWDMGVFEEVLSKMESSGAYLR